MRSVRFWGDNVKRIGLGLFLLLSSLTASARPVRITLWISGGTQGQLTAGREAPGRLGIIAHILENDPDGYWIDIGGCRDTAVQNGLPAPQALIPGLELLQTGGLTAIMQADLPWTALNVGILPQYPEVPNPLPTRQDLQHPDGPRMTVIGLLPADTPLRVPPALLRPLRILPPEDALQTVMADLRASPAFPLVALPEGTDPGEWSRRFPDLPLLIEPPSANPAVISLAEGRRLRVRPALHGRALIRVTLVWDTVRQTFAPPVAEVEWVRAPNLSLLDLPPGLALRLRPLPEAPEPADLRNAWIDRLLARSEADTALIPVLPTRPPPHPHSPESWRSHLFPWDFAWIPAVVDADTHRAWRRLDLPGYEWTGKRTGAARILLPSPLAAGDGRSPHPFRQPRSSAFTPAPPPPFTARDLLF